MYTSSLSSIKVDFIGNVPKTRCGFGISYITNPNNIAVSVTAYSNLGHENACFLSSKIEKAFVDMRTVLEACPASSP